MVSLLPIHEIWGRSNVYWHRSGSQSRSWTLDDTEMEDVGEVKEEWSDLESACMVSQGKVMCPSHKTLESYIFPPSLFSFSSSHPRIVLSILYLAQTITVVFRASCSIPLRSIFYLSFGGVIPKCIYYHVTHLLKIFQWLWTVFVPNFSFSRAHRGFHEPAQ